ncbi:MAG TPA: hypothetical protein VMZ91_07715 [Candidatus Paceibacterota bacterium]|nr:hypothetical protein [Candidatus Paceibacterota bacterium]
MADKLAKDDINIEEKITIISVIMFMRYYVLQDDKFKELYIKKYGSASYETLIK